MLKKRGKLERKVKIHMIHFDWCIAVLVMFVVIVIVMVIIIIMIIVVNIIIIITAMVFFMVIGQWSS